MCRVEHYKHYVKFVRIEHEKQQNTDSKSEWLGIWDNRNCNWLEND